MSDEQNYYDKYMTDMFEIAPNRKIVIKHYKLLKEKNRLSCEDVLNQRWVAGNEDYSVSMIDAMVAFPTFKGNYWDVWPVLPAESFDYTRGKTNYGYGSATILVLRIMRQLFDRGFFQSYLRGGKKALLSKWDLFLQEGKVELNGNFYEPSVTRMRCFRTSWKKVIPHWKVFISGKDIVDEQMEISTYVLTAAITMTASAIGMILYNAVSQMQTSIKTLEVAVATNMAEVRNSAQSVAQDVSMVRNTATTASLKLAQTAASVENMLSWFREMFGTIKEKICNVWQTISEHSCSFIVSLMAVIVMYKVIKKFKVAHTIVDTYTACTYGVADSLEDQEEDVVKENGEGSIYNSLIVLFSCMLGYKKQASTISIIARGITPHIEKLTLGTHLKEFINKIWMLFHEKPFFTKSPVEIYKESYNRMYSMKISEMHDILRNTDTEYCKKFASYLTGFKLYDELIRGSKPGDDFYPYKTEYVLLKSWADKENVLVQRRLHSTAVAKPTIVCLVGEAGQGKDIILGMLTRYIQEEYEKQGLINKMDIDSLTFSGKAPGEKFVDGYAGQLIWRNKEFLQMADPQLNAPEASLFLQLANGGVVALPMAMAEKKGTSFFNSKYIFLDSNKGTKMKGWMNSGVDEEAIKSRPHFYFEVSANKTKDGENIEYDFNAKDPMEELDKNWTLKCVYKSKSRRRTPHGLAEGEIMKVSDMFKGVLAHGLRKVDDDIETKIKHMSFNTVKPDRFLVKSEEEEEESSFSPLIEDCVDVGKGVGLNIDDSLSSSVSEDAQLNSMSSDLPTVHYKEKLTNWKYRKAWAHTSVYFKLNLTKELKSSPSKGATSEEMKLRKLMFALFEPFREAILTGGLDEVSPHELIIDKELGVSLPWTSYLAGYTSENITIVANTDTDELFVSYSSEQLVGETPALRVKYSNVNLCYYEMASTQTYIFIQENASSCYVKEVATIIWRLGKFYVFYKLVKMLVNMCKSIYDWIMGMFLEDEVIEDSQYEHVAKSIKPVAPAPAKLEKTEDGIQVVKEHSGGQVDPVLARIRFFYVYEQQCPRRVGPVYMVSGKKGFICKHYSRGEGIMFGIGDFTGSNIYTFDANVIKFNDETETEILPFRIVSNSISIPGVKTLNLLSRSEIQSCEMYRKSYMPTTVCKTMITAVARGKFKEMHSYKVDDNGVLRDRKRSDLFILPELPSWDGVCCSPYVVYKGKYKDRVIALHFASGSLVTYAGAIYSEMFPPDNETPVRYESEIVDCGGGYVPPGLNYVGRHKYGYLSPYTTSMYQESPLREIDKEIPNNGTRPLPVSPYVEDGKKIEPVYRALKFHTNEPFCNESVVDNHVYEKIKDFMEGFLPIEEIEPYDNWTDVVFDDPLDHTTTVGFRLKNKGITHRSGPEENSCWDSSTRKVHPWFISEMDEYQEKHRDYNIPAEVVGRLKDDLYAESKEWARFYMQGKLEDLMLVKKYLGPFFMHMKRCRNVGSPKVGMNPYGFDWMSMIKELRMYDYDSGGDCKGLDRSIVDKFKTFFFQYIKLFYAKKHWLWLERAVYKICSPLIIIGHNVYVGFGINPSGGYMTTPFNCFVVYLVHSVGWTLTMMAMGKDELVFHKHSILPTFGDDHWFASNVDLDLTLYRRVILSGFGIKITTEDKTMDFRKGDPKNRHRSDRSFLKRFPREVTYQGVTLEVGALDKDSLYQMLLWIHSKEDIKVLLPAILTSFFIEATLHGEHFYEEWRIPIQRYLDENLFSFEIPMFRYYFEFHKDMMFPEATVKRSVNIQLLYSTAKLLNFLASN